MGAYAQPVSTLPAGGRSLGLTTFDHRLQAGATSCDLSELRFIDAYGLVGVACTLLAAAKAGDHPPIEYPGQSQVCEHLTRTGFRDLLRQLDYPVVLPEAAPIERPDVLVPLTRTDRVFDAEQLSHLLHEQLRDHADPPQVLEATLEGLWELAANALEHSGSEAVIMGQVYREGDLPSHIEPRRKDRGDRAAARRDAGMHVVAALPWRVVMTTLYPPAHAGSREQARALVARLPEDLAGSGVAVDCSELTIGSPSFFDELVKQILIVRKADLLDVISTSQRARTLLQRAAYNRNVVDRLRFELHAA